MTTQTPKFIAVICGKCECGMYCEWGIFRRELLDVYIERLKMTDTIGATFGSHKGHRLTVKSIEPPGSQRLKFH